MDSIPPYPPAIERFFSTLPLDSRGEIPDALRLLADLRAELHRSERRITFIGAVKTGKSSLVNALLGASLAPVRAYRTARVLTCVSHGLEPHAAIVRPGVGREEISFDAVRALQWPVDGLGPVGEMNLAVPLPLLANGAVLVDTPGLLENEALDEITYKELFRADLAVLVLAADKILSARERDVAAWANELLHGNVVFVVNRLDLVEEGDRDDVMEWARSALGDTGNALVGQARMFATSTPLGGDTDVGQLRTWLEGILRSDAIARVARVSRMGVVEHHLREARGRLAQERDEAARRAAVERERHYERVMTERAAARKAIAEGRVRLEAARERLRSSADTFVARCLEEERANLARHGDTRAVRKTFDAALAQYTATVRTEIDGALAGVPITRPPLRLSELILRTPLDPINDPARNLGVTLGEALTRIVDGGRTGRDAGAAIGGWIGKHVLGIDAQAETLRRIESVARAVMHSTEREVEEYLTSVFGLLADADATYETWSDASPAAEEAEQWARHVSGLLQWCEGFLRAVERAEKEALSVPGGSGG